MGGIKNEHPTSVEGAAAGEMAGAAASFSIAGTITHAAAADANAGASVDNISVGGAQDFKAVEVGTFEIGDKVEYRRGREGKWYGCEVTKVAGEGQCQEVELEFLSRKKRKTKAGRMYSESLKVVDLEADGDIASPGTHLNHA